MNEIHKGDCTELLKGLPDASAQLVIADPPYNIGPKFGIDREWIHDSDWIRWSREWLAQCQRVLSPEGNLFVYGIHHYLCYLQVELYDMGMHYRRQVIWNYENGFSGFRRTLATHYEPILWFSKSENYYFGDPREPYKSTERLKNPITKKGKVWSPNPAGRRIGDVWRFPTLAGRRFRAEKVDHPTQKPLALSERIVEHFSAPGNLVVVPFAGSGTECLAAQRLGRNFWGSEIHPDFVTLAKSRLGEETDTVDAI